MKNINLLYHLIYGINKKSKKRKRKREREEESNLLQPEVVQ
jgi:uncharacterized membrane protein YsdA (DUF1294 family)